MKTNPTNVIPKSLHMHPMYPIPNAFPSIDCVNHCVTIATPQNTTPCLLTLTTPLRLKQQQQQPTTNNQQLQQQWKLLNENQNHNNESPTTTLNKCIKLQVGQHLKKSSLSESSSDMMDLDDGVESTPGLTETHPGRSAAAPFLGASQSQLQATQQQQYQQQQQLQLQQQSVYKQQQQSTTNVCAATGSAGTSLTMRHNNALAVSIETDVWLLGKCSFYSTPRLPWNPTIFLPYSLSPSVFPHEYPLFTRHKATLFRTAFCMPKYLSIRRVQSFVALPLPVSISLSLSLCLYICLYKLSAHVFIPIPIPQAPKL